MELPNNHVTLNSTQEMQAMRLPLKRLHIDFFSYTRFYLDGTSISLLTHTDWYQFFLKQEVPGCINVFNLETGCNLWSELFPEQAVADAKSQFGIDNGIHFSYRHESYVEAISFASKVNDRNAMGFFIANIDLLEKFIVYFREKASKLIQKALGEKIVIPKIMRGYEDIHTGYRLSHQDRIKFLTEIGYEDINRLSDREYECLECLAHGMSAKHSAKALNISPRTVETHINNIKNKFSCASKLDLLNLYWDINGTFIKDSLC